MIAERDDGPDGAFEEARSQIARGDVRRGFLLLLDALKVDPRHGPALEASARAAKILGDSRGATLLEELGRDPEDPERLYHLGYHLVAVGRADVAAAFLQACADRVPDNHDVRYELGFALFRTRKYGEAYEALSAAAEHLSPERSAAADLLRIESLLYSDRVDQADELMRRLSPELHGRDRGDSLEALELMAARLRRFRGRSPAGVREWHLVQHGGVILAESRIDESQGRFRSLAMNAAAVGALIRLLRAFLNGMNLMPDAVLHLGGDSYTLALATASLLERPLRAFESRTGANELLVIPDAGATAGVAPDLVSRESVASLFCFRLDPGAESPVLPEIAGLVAAAFRFPWQERVEMAVTEGGKPVGRRVPPDRRDRETVAAEIAALGKNLPEDRHVPKALKFYQRHRDLLVIVNREAFPRRRAFTPHSPI